MRINSRLEITKPYRILVHFVDIPKLERQYEFLFTYLTPLTRITKLLLTVLYFSHFIGCFWFFVSKLQGYPSDCWVVGSGLLDSDWETQYLISIYWAFTTVSSVGYGDISGGNATERNIAIVIMIAGTAFYAYAIGNLTAMIASLDDEHSNLDY